MTAPPLSAHKYSFSTGSSPAASASGLPRPVNRQPVRSMSGGSVGEHQKLVRGPASFSRLPISTSSTSSPPRASGYSTPPITEEMEPVPPPPEPKQTLITAGSRFGRKNSLFEVVDPNVQPPVSPTRPPRPPSLILEPGSQGDKEDTEVQPDSNSLSAPTEAPPQPVESVQGTEDVMSRSESPAPPASTADTSDEEERILRTQLLAKLEEAFGKRVLAGVDSDAIIAMRAENPGPAAKPSSPVAPQGESNDDVSKDSSGMSRSESSQSEAKRRKKGLFGFGSGKKLSKKGHSGQSKLPTPAAQDHSAAPLSGVFGRSLADLPKAATCVTRIGENQEHVLPIIVFATVEEMYRKGLKSPSLFRRLGDAGRIDYLTDTFNKPPTYGDGIHLEEEALDTTAGLFKRFLRDMPEPIFDRRLFELYTNAILKVKATHEARIGAAQTILRLLPRQNFSLFVYLVAFLGQLVGPKSSVPNGVPNGAVDGGTALDHGELSILLGPAIMAPRKSDVTDVSKLKGLRAESTVHIQDNIAPVPKQTAQMTLQWTLEHWSAICGAPIDLSQFQPLPQDDAEAGKAQTEGAAAEVLASATFDDPLNASEDEAMRASEANVQARRSSATLESVVGTYGSPIAMPTTKPNRYVDDETATGLQQSQPAAPESPLATWRRSFDAKQTVAVVNPRHSPTSFQQHRMKSSQGSVERANSPTQLASAGQAPAIPLPLLVSRESPLTPEPVRAPLSDHGQFPMPMLVSANEDTTMMNGNGPRHLQNQNKIDSGTDQPHPIFTQGAPFSNLVDRSQSPSREKAGQSFPLQTAQSAVIGNTTSEPQIAARSDSETAMEKRRAPRKIASLVEELHRRYGETEDMNERLKADHDVLLRRIAEQEARSSQDRESHQAKVDEMSREVNMLKSRLAESQQRRAAEDDELTKHWREAAQTAQREAQQSRESTSSELDRLIRIVKDLTKERDQANRKLRHIRKALNQNHAGSTSSLVGDMDNGSP